MIEPNAYVVPKRTVFSFTAAPRKKRCPEAARRGWRRPGRGWTGLPPRACGCGGLREAGMCGGKRPQPGWAAPPEGGRPCPKVPLRGGPLSAPQGCRACATRKRAPGIFPKSKAYRTHQRGRGSSPSHQAGTEEPPGRPQREYSHRPTRGTAATPPSPPSQASPPPARGTGRPLAHIGGAALRTGTGRERGRERRRHPLKPRPPPPARGAAPRALPGKGTAATCRTASGFRPRPLP